MHRLCLLLMIFAIPATGQTQTTRLVGDLPRQSGKPLVNLPGLDTEYSHVRTSEGVRLRTIITRPANARKRLPAIFLTQWVSCGSLDFTASATNQLKEIAERSGMVLIRLERTGTGDSEGPQCNALDYDTEVRHYREALDEISSHSWVDPDRIIIFGSSLGATTAPLVAAGRKVAGIVVQGGGALTYIERMINFDRSYLERSGRYAPGQIHEEMAKRIPFHVEYLLNRKTPAQVERERPELAGIWQSIRGGAEAPPHYGRPYAWHWQAAAKDFLDAWTKVEAPVLVFYGEYDQFETRHGHRLIVDTVNRLRPGTATYVEIEAADHDLQLYNSAEDAYADRNSTGRSDIFVEMMLEWARRVAKTNP